MPFEMGAIAGVAGSVVIPIYAIDRSSHVFHRVATKSLYLQTVGTRLTATMNRLDATIAKNASTIKKLGITEDQLVVKLAYEEQNLRKLNWQMSNAAGTTDAYKRSLFKQISASEKRIQQMQAELILIRDKSIALEKENSALKRNSAAYHFYTGSIQTASIAHETFNRWIMLSGVSLAALTVPVMGAAMAIKDYQRELVNAASILDLNREAMYNMGAEAVRVSGIYAKSAKEIASGLYHLASAGLNQAEIQQILIPSMRMAMATQADYAKSAKYLLQGMKAFNIEMERASEITDIFTWIIQHSLVTWDKLGEGIKFAAPWFATTGQSIEELAAAIGVLTDRGLEAGIAGRGLRQTMAMMTKRSEVAGVSMYDSAGNVKKFSDIVFEFAEKYPKDEEKLEAAMESLGIRGATAFVSLVMGAESFREKLVGLQDATGTTERLATYQMRSIGAQLELLKNKMLAPILLSSEFADKFQELLEPIGDMFYTAEGGVGELGAKIQELLLRSLQEVFDIIRTGDFQNFIGNLLDTMVLMVPVWRSWSEILLVILRALNAMGPSGMKTVIMIYTLNKILPIHTILATNASFAWRSFGVSIMGAVGAIMLFSTASSNIEKIIYGIITAVTIATAVWRTYALAKWAAAHAEAGSWVAKAGPAAPFVAAAIGVALASLTAAIFAAQTSVPKAHEGGLVTRSGFAEIHKGEVIVPEAGVTHAPVINFYNVGLDEAQAKKYGELAAESYEEYLQTH